MLHSSSFGFLKQLRNAAWQGPAKAATPLRSRSQMPAWLKVFRFFLLLVGVLFGQLGAPLAHAMPLVDAFPPLPSSGDGTPPLGFHGGWVQQHPEVYLVFLGPKWDVDATHISIRSQVIATFGVLAGSQYNNILTQYRNPNDTANPDNYVHNDVTLKGYMTDTTTPPSVPLDIGVESPGGGLFGIGQIRAEAVYALNALHVQPDKDVQVIVFPQQGTTYTISAACGMHSYDSYDFSQPFTYSYARYADSGSGCNMTGDIPQSTAWVAVHEYAETATDPHIYLTVNPQVIHGSGWNTGEAGWTPYETGDLCQNYTPNTAPYFDTHSWPTYFPTNTSLALALPLLWSNADNGCVASVGKEYPSPVAPTRHTVQQPMLAVYQQYGEDTGFLGQPVSERAPIAGGWVSYFQGTSCSGSTYGAIYAGGGGTHEVHGCVDQKYQSLGGPTSYLGFPTSDQLNITGGHVNYFQGTSCSSSTYGAIYSGSPGVYAVHGCIDQKYLDLGGSGSFLGFPTSDESLISGGYVNYFQGTTCGSQTYGAIYAGGGGTHEVHGCIYHEYTATMGGPAGLLGFPVADETSIAGGRVSYFAGQVCNGGHVITDENGTSRTSGSAIYHDGTAGNHEVHGCIYALYTGGMGGPGGSMGFPLSDEQDAVNGGRVSYFAGHGCSTGSGPYSSGSAIYYNAGDTYFVWGCIYARYQATCQEISAPCVNLLGLPTSDEVDITGGHVSYFQGASCSGSTYGAVYSSGAGVYEVHGCIDKKYQSLSGPASYLGFPTSDEIALTGGHVSYFQGTSCSGSTYGAIYSASPGVYAVRGCIDKKYQNLGGSGSYLGFPTSDEIALTGGHVTYFQGSSCGGPTYGAIYSSASGVYAVHGCIDQKYESLGGPSSNLGFPVSDEYTNSAGHRESDFAGGSIVYENGAAVVTLNCVGLGTCV